MIYAKVDVKLRDHERAHRAGVAMATWTWALLYVREQESDGFIPDVALRGSWVGERESMRHASKLVEVGLWEKTDGGWRICRYAEKNETKAAIEQRRLDARARMNRVRANKYRTSEEPSPTEQPAVPGSGSGFEFVEVGDRVGVLRGVGGPGEGTPAVDSATPPEWFEAAAATASMAVGDIHDLPAKWLSYRASRGRKGWSKNHEDAVGWLSEVAGRERREASERQAREAKWDRKRAGPGSLADQAPVSAAQEAAALAVLRDRMAKRKGAA
jgi:hypothetical protein